MLRQPLTVDLLTMLSPAPFHAEAYRLLMRDPMWVVKNNRRPEAWSFDGKVVVVLGINMHNYAWVVTSSEARQHGTAIIRHGVSYLHEVPPPRPLLHRAKNSTSARLAKLLGCRHLAGDTWVFG